MKPMADCIPPADLAKGRWWSNAWSLTSGCTAVSAGCAHCWSASIATRFPNKPIYAGTAKGGKWTGEVRFNPGQLDKPLRTKTQRVFAVWNDLFHPAVTDAQIDAAFAIMLLAPQHWFIVLTKRPKRMRDYLVDLTDHDEWRSALWDADYPRHEARLQLLENQDRSVEYAGRDTPLFDALWTALERPFDEATWPLPNVILGTSVEDQATADERIPLLLDTPAAYRMVSYEPALASVRWRLWFPHWRCECGLIAMPLTDDTSCDCNDMYKEAWTHTPGIDWLVAGSETGPGARPCDLDWLRDARGRCAGTRTAFFLKRPNELDGKTHQDFPA